MCPILDSQRVVADSTTQPYGLCELGHQGLYHDEEIGIIYNRARYVHPLFGTFMSWDPFAYVDGANLFEYLSGNPPNHSDPTGWYSHDIHMELTYLLASAAGYSEEAATQVGGSDDGADYGEHLRQVGAVAVGTPLEYSKYPSRVVGPWQTQVFWELWHLAGVRGRPGVRGGIVAYESPEAQEVLGLLREAAVVGGAYRRMRNWGPGRGGCWRGRTADGAGPRGAPRSPPDREKVHEPIGRKVQWGSALSVSSWL